MSLVKRVAVAVLIMAAVMGLVHVLGEHPTSSAGRAPVTEAYQSHSATTTGSGPGYAMPTPGTPELPDPGVASPAPSSPRPLPAPSGQQGPAVNPRPPATLDGVRLVPGRWVMPMAPRSYRVGCAYACYVSDSGLPHTGQDFPASVGTVVRSVGAGRVLRSESIYLVDGEKTYCQARPICGQNWTSYGNFVEVQDAADPSLTVWYAHLATRVVVPGQWLAAGQPLGRSGNVGNSEGPHLHFEVRRDNKAMDPMPVLQAHGAAAQPGTPPPASAAPAAP